MTTLTTPPTPAEHTTDPDLSPEDRQMLERIARLKRQTEKYRGDKRTGKSMTLKGEWIESAERFMGNAIRASASLDDLQEGFRVFTNVQDGAAGANGLHVVRITRTQNAVVSGVASSTVEPIRCQINPVETHRGDTGYLTRRGRRRIAKALAAAHAQVEAEIEAQSTALEDAAQQNTEALAVDPEAATRAQAAIAEQESLTQRQEQAHAEVEARFGNLTPQQLIPEDGQGPAALDEEQLDAMDELIAAGMIRDDDVVRISDRFVSRCAQEIMDWMWVRGNVDFHLMNGKLFNDIFGQCDFKFEWDDKLKRFTIQPCHILNIYTDHTEIDIGLRSHHIETYQITIEQAKARWPQHAALLDRAKQGGDAQNEHTLGGIYEQGLDPETMMVRVDVAHFRYENVPMTMAEAIDAGDVLATTAEDGQTLYTLAATGEAVEQAPESLAEAQQQNRGRRGQWPITTGVLQVVSLPTIERVISRQRCPYIDIPHAWSITIPRPDMSAYGIPEPIRARDIDDQINRVLSILGSYIYYYEFPCYFWPASVMRRMQATGHSLFARPGANIPVPDEEWAEVMRVGGFERMQHRAVTIPESILTFLNTLLSLHDDVMQRADVMQGRAPFSGASGRTVETLAEQAMGPVAFKSRYFEIAIERLCYLALDALAQWMDANHARRILDRYEEPVIREVLDRMRAMEFDVKVEITTGRGAVKRQRQNAAIQKHGAGLLSTRTAMVETDVEDPDREIEQIATERQMLVAGPGASTLTGARQIAEGEG